MLQFQIIYIIAAGGLVVFVVYIICGGDIEDETLLFVDVMHHVRIRWDDWHTSLLLHQLSTLSSNNQLCEGLVQSIRGKPDKA